MTEVAPHLKARRLLRKAWQYVVSYYPSRRADGPFSHIRTFVMFLGYPRSGHTLVGSLVDAHPNAVIANELNMIGHVKRGFSKRQIYTLILRNARAFARNGSTWTGYSYAVPNQWQGRFTTLEVIGDKRGPGAIRLLRSNPGLLEHVQQTIGTEIRYIHVVRNPFDNISTIVLRHHWPLEKATAYYVGLCRSVADLKTRIGPHAMLDVWHEDLVGRPEEQIRALCVFLGLEPFPDFIRDCAGIVFRTPRQSRSDIAWPPEAIETVRSQVQAFPWLRRYTYEA